MALGDRRRPVGPSLPRDGSGARSTTAPPAVGTVPTVPRLLVVEDDPAIAQPLVRSLERQGYEVTAVLGGRAAIDAVAAGGVDLVLLDLSLPDLDGLDVCRQLRERAADVPIVILTARAEEVDVVVGLDAGADDYVTKPFRLAELMARVRARLRLAPSEEPAEMLAAQDVRLDLAAHRAYRGSAEIELTPKEFELLGVLVSEAGRVVPRRRLLHDIWHTDWHGSTRTIDMHVSALRRKLGDDPASPRLITTVRGVGFRFETA